MKLIQLTRGAFSIVDDEDFEEVNKYKWNYVNSRYAYRSYRKNDERTGRLLHRFIMKIHGLLIENLEVDHINRNKLDNQKSNLRVATRKINRLNSKLYKNNTSGYRGLCYNKKMNRYSAAITVNNKRIYLGNYAYEDKKSAAQKYNEAAIKYNGEFAQLNKI